MKKSRHKSPQFRLRPLCAAVLLATAMQAAQANPTGGSVINGQASISTSGNTLTVTNTPGTIIHWQDFSIGTDEITRFVQQSAASTVLNRVVSSNPSNILGSLQSNGRVFLVNPNGIIFGMGATIDVAGLVASSLNLSDDDFIAGRHRYTEVPGAQKISNAGNITAQSGGQIYLIAPDVENTGVITAPNGEILLTAGHSVELVDSSEPSLRVNITAPAGDATNVGQLVAEAGSLGLFGTVIKSSGTVSADSATMRGGKIVFKASQRVEVSGAVSANGTTGGLIEVLGDQVDIMDGASLSADGAQGGGTILVGGDYQGNNPDVQNATVTYVAATATISADATDNGDGGKVIVWADDTTRAYGNISARGGDNGGDGGFVEVSGKQLLVYRAFTDTRAPLGKTGTLLLDPTSIGLIAGAGTDDNSAVSTLYGENITTALGASNVILQTGAGGTGDITFTAGSYNFAAAGTTNSLSLLAYTDGAVSTGNINLPTGTNITMFSGAALNMVAGWDGGSTSVPAVMNGFGNLDMTGSSVSAGTVKLAAGNDVTLTSSTVTAGGAMTVDAGGDLTLTAGTSNTMLKANGAQTINFTGAVAHTLSLLGGTIANSAGAGDGASIEAGTTQTISHAGTLAISLTGGDVTDNTLSSTKDSVTICTSCATHNSAYIKSTGAQTINASTITLQGGSGGNGNQAAIESKSSQNITTTGAISITGGSSGGIFVSAANESVSNDASIQADGAQTVNAASIAMVGGGDASTIGGAFLTGKTTQTITTSGNLSMTGGAGNTAGQYGLGAVAVIGEELDADITLNIGGSLTMVGGSGSTSGVLIGSAQGTPEIDITAASISMTAGAGSNSRIGVLTGGPAGALTMTASGGISQDATSSINTATLSASSTGAAINLAGANLVNTVSSLSAYSNISYTSAQTVHIGSATSSMGGTVSLTTTGAGHNLYLGTASGTVVNVTSAGGIYDDNGSGTNNITATTSSTLISTGATLGDLGISMDVNTPSITATVSGSYGGVSIRSASATAPTTIALTDSATVTPQGVSFSHSGANTLVLDGTKSFTAGGGSVTISSGNDLTYSGAAISSTGTTKLDAAGTLNVNSNLSVSGGLTMNAATINLTGAGASAGTDVNATASGDIRLNDGGHIQASNDVFITLSGASSTLYLNDTAGMANDSYILANAPSTTHLKFLARSSGGVVIDGVETLSTSVGGSGFFTGSTSTPAVQGAGLVVTYGITPTVVNSIVNEVVVIPTGVTSNDTTIIGSKEEEKKDAPVVEGASAPVAENTSTASLPVCK